MKIEQGPFKDSYNVHIKGVQYNLYEEVSDLLFNISKERDEFYEILEHIVDRKNRTDSISFDTGQKILDVIKTQREYRTKKN